MKIKPVIDNDYYIVNYVFAHNSRCVIHKYNKKGIGVPLDALLRPVTKWRKFLMRIHILPNSDIRVYQSVRNAQRAAEKLGGIRIVQVFTEKNNY
ncbi:hypothetical protein SDC9_58953 [bioreactor metagenome]|uniref:Uncharacterized protein n=1 Tax=bioreactor metagenome TaxID=1076179 RepID=A0A644X950_9ZZZZ